MIYLWFQTALKPLKSANRPSEKKSGFQTASKQRVLGSVHHSSRGNLLAQKRACRVENARKVSNLAALFALQARFCAQNLTHG
jgi:hypothetical protein